MTTPLLYLRGSHQGGDIDDYAKGVKADGVLNVTTHLIPDAGHFAPEEAPNEVRAAIVSFTAPPFTRALANPPVAIARESCRG